LRSLTKIYFAIVDKDLSPSATFRTRTHVGSCEERGEREEREQEREREKERDVERERARERERERE
jgi:hypothetical protein